MQVTVCPLTALKDAYLNHGPLPLGGRRRRAGAPPPCVFSDDEYEHVLTELRAHIVEQGERLSFVKFTLHRWSSNCFSVSVSKKGRSVWRAEIEDNYKESRT